MRVLYWSESFWPRIGGSEVAAQTLIDSLRGRGHQFEVVTRRWSVDQPEHDSWRGVPIHRIDFDDAALLRLDLNEILPLRQRVARIKRDFAPDLIHIGLTGPTLFLHNFTAGQYPAPMLITMHVAPVDNEYGHNKPVPETIRAARWIAPVSRDLLAELHRREPKTRERSGVIYNGLPEPTIQPTPISFSPPRLLAVGRVTEQKGFDTAVAAMPAILKQFSDAELTIAGDGEMLESVRNHAKQLGVAEHVKLPGWVLPDDVPKMIAASTLVLMPSRWEPFGLVALQTAQLARPCLASRVGGLPEVVRDGETGLLLPPDEPIAWSDAIISLLNDPARTAVMGRAGRTFVTRTFSVERHVNTYESLYHRLVGGHMTAAPGRQEVSA